MSDVPGAPDHGPLANMNEAREVQAANARTFAAALAAQGVGPVVISPGSRSTPLVLACAEHPDLETISVLDERSAAFFALGWARASGHPAVLLCTSGSAAGHYLPAIMEANAAEVPLLVVTANRPIERESSGASQTAVQRHLYGQEIRRDYEVDLTLGTDRGRAAVRRVVAQAGARTKAPAPGPVHVDVRLRKPLEPDEWPAAAADSSATTRWWGGCWQADNEAIDEIVGMVHEAERPILFAGPAPRHAVAAATAAASLAETGLPLVCEWTSQLRGQSRFWALGAGLQSAAVRERLRPDLMLQVGTAPVSSGWEPWIEQCVAAGTRHVVVQGGRMRDARSTATHVLTCDSADFLEGLAGGLRRDEGHSRWQAWRQTVKALHSRVVQVLEREWNASGLELHAARAVVSESPSGILGLGNSLAIRHVEGVPTPESDEHGGWSWVWHQRGLSGIDGLIAGMAGSLRAAATEAGEAVPARLLLGDVSLVHDIGSLGLLRAGWARKLDVVVLDNEGGRIFERLPLENLPLDASTRELFATPQTLDLAGAVGAWGLDYREVDDLDGLTAALGSRRDQARVLHVRCCAGVGTDRSGKQRRGAAGADAEVAGPTEHPDTKAEVTSDHRRILAALDDLS